MTKVPYQMRTGAITNKALADLSTTSGRGFGLSMQLPARFYEQYREVTPDDSDLQTPLASLVDRSVYNVFDQTPAPPAYHEPSECVESDTTARQEKFRASLVKSGTLRALSQEYGFCHAAERRAEPSVCTGRFQDDTERHHFRDTPCAR